MPVYNGAAHLPATLDSVRAQTFQDWTLVVSDNASTDESREIVEKYAASDERIVLLENHANQGAVWNYNNAFRKAPVTEYFMWLSADDVLKPDYLSRAVDLLDRDSMAIGAYSRAYRINAAGTRVGDFDRAAAFVRLDGASPSARHRRALLGMPAIVVFGLYRREIMASSGLHYECVGGDRAFVCDMALRGRIREIPEQLFARREHDLQFSGGALSARERSEFMGVATSANELVHRLRTHFAVIGNSQITPKEKLRCAASVLVEFPVLKAALRVRARLQR